MFSKLRLTFFMAKFLHAHFLSWLTPELNYKDFPCVLIHHTRITSTTMSESFPRCFKNSKTMVSSSRDGGSPDKCVTGSWGVVIWCAQMSGRRRREGGVERHQRVFTTQKGAKGGKWVISRSEDGFWNEIVLLFVFCLCPPVIVIFISSMWRLR